jgi:SAM-dependent methyltransferase
LERVAYQAMAEIEGRHWWFVGRRAIIRSIIEKRIRPGRNARVLEAGCGTGGNLAMLGDYGSLAALEYDDDARAIARERTGVDVQPGRLPDGIDHIDGPFQMITLFDVLEHLDEDEESLRSLSKLLAADGKIILTVPALQFLWSDHDVVHHHHRRYSSARLRDVLERAGLQVEYISYFNSLLLPAAILQRLASRFSKKQAAIDDVPPTAVNSLLTKIFAAERSLLSWFRLPIGLSLCAVCSAK